MRSRLQDGLDTVHKDINRDLFPPGYKPSGTLKEFICGLPDEDCASTDPRWKGWNNGAELYQFAKDRAKVHLGGVNLPEEDAAAIVVSTIASEIYPQLNKALRDNTDLDKWRPFAWFLFWALQRLPAPPEPLSVFLGFPDPSPSSEYYVGKRIVWRSFSSASPDVYYASRFLKQDCSTLFLVETKSFRDVEFLNVYGEAETIILPNTAFKVQAIMGYQGKEVMKDVMVLKDGDDKIIDISKIAVIHLVEEGLPESTVPFRAMFEKYLHGFTQDAETLCFAGAVLFHIFRDSEAAQKKFELALQLKPDDAKARCHLAALLSSRGRPDDAKRQYEEALRLNPEDADARAGLAFA